MPTEHGILQVAVPAPLYRLFDYLPPRDFIPSRPLGCRVRVPFGRRHLTGIILGRAERARIERSALKRVDEVLDEQCIFAESELLELCRWAAGYYVHPIGEVLACALPRSLRQGRSAVRAQVRGWRLTAAGAGVEAPVLSRAPRQAEVMESLPEDGGAVRESTLKLELGDVGPILKRLREKGWVESVTLPLSVHEPEPEGWRNELNPEQERALQQFRDHSDRFRVMLLEGVTGSGKTEVYLRAAEAILEQQRQVLVLVPEIGLTPQLVARFRERLPGPLAVFHSGLSDSERVDGWLAARDGDARVVLGTRSALFTPLARPGLIVVDEEHDGAYKQQEGFRYSARDLAVRRAQLAGIPVLLGSATPSLESLRNVHLKRYEHARLPRRAAGAASPELRLLDLRGQPLREGLSPPLIRQARSHLEAGGQVLFFLNRRGYAPTLLCHDCGWTAECRRCDARMTLHQRSGRLRCHHCGADRRRDTVCVDCGGNNLLALGQGTERIEAVLREEFPEYPLTRVDRDSTGRKGEFERIMKGVETGETRILVGTQMLAKGHHFPALTLVGVLNADQGLYSTDFRATEHMAQLVTQVAGRAGRGARPGEVLIQTHQPGHPLLVRLIREGYASFAEAALAEREETGLPPFSHLALVRAESTREQAALTFLQQAAEELGGHPTPGVELWGPVPAPMERRAGRIRAQLLVHAAKRSDLHRALEPWIPFLSALPGAHRVRWSLDVDPRDLM